ncbi:MAG: LolA family protein [Acidobacteriota bacterium]
MKKTIVHLLFCFLAITLIPPSGYSQDVDKIRQKMIEAQGGVKLLESIKDSTLIGTMEMIQMGLNGSVTMYQKEPNKMRMDAEIMGMTVTQAYDGEIAWMINPQTGAAEQLPPDVTSEIKRQAMGNDTLLHPEKYGITYAYAGKEKIGEKEYHVLEQNFSDGFKASLYIDPDTYLTYKTKAKTINQMGLEVEAESVFSGYKEINGTIVPHQITIYQDGEEFMIMKVTEVKYNSGLENSFFKMT